MKNPIIKQVVFVILVLIATGLHAEGTEARVVNIENPAQSIGVHIGDVLIRKIELVIPAPYQLSKNAFPVKGTNTNGLELFDFKVGSSQEGNNTHYKLDLSYQVFANTSSPSVMHLPAEKFVLTGGVKALTINIPVWRFWFSPLVAGHINIAKDSLQPQQPPLPVDIGRHQARLAIFLSLLVAGQIGLLYVNADRKWLPFMGGAFAQAHRQLKRLPVTHAGEKNALYYLHQAFNRVYGSNLFAKDIDQFLTAHPSFARLRAEIETFFERSNQSLFSTQKHESDSLIQDLLTLSKGLRDCERGI